MSRLNGLDIHGLKSTCTLDDFDPRALCLLINPNGAARADAPCTREST